MCVWLFFGQKTAYDVRISDWNSDVCSSDLGTGRSRRRIVRFVVCRIKSPSVLPVKERSCENSLCTARARAPRLQGAAAPPPLNAMEPGQPMPADALTIDFEAEATGAAPSGFSSAVTKGRTGAWRVERKS